VEKPEVPEPLAAERGQPTISAVLPAYNEEAVIAETVRRTGDALAALGIADFEVLVVDDGSSDDTAAPPSGAGGPRRY